MVERDIAARGVRDELVLDAMRKVPRELFLPKRLREFAYEDSPLPIAGEQTISQPYIVAFMAEALMLKGGEEVLEIGAGSGYAAAVLSEIAANVYSVERLGPLAERAAETLAELGYDNVHVLHGDGTRGWPDHAPYYAIVVAAGGPQVPESLKEQLKIGGRLVNPIGSPGYSSSRGFRSGGRSGRPLGRELVNTDRRRIATYAPNRLLQSRRLRATPETSLTWCRPSTDGREPSSPLRRSLRPPSPPAANPHQ